MESYISQEVQTDEIAPLRRKLNLSKYDLFSTPPSELRRENIKLRDEIYEAHEFHDLEFKILQEEHNTAESKNDVTIAELQKSLENAEGIILDSKKEICNLKTLNQELQQQLKEQSNKIINLKEQHEHQISQLQDTLKKKSYEIENFKKDKNDYELHIQSLRKNYEQKIDELRETLEQRCEKNNGNKEKSFNTSETSLNNDNDKAEALNEIRCTYEKEIKKLKDEHNDALKSLEFNNSNLKQANESLTEKLREANETVEELKEQLRIFEDKTELLGKLATITKMNDSAGERCNVELETLYNRIVDSCLVSHKNAGNSEIVRKEFEGYKVSENADTYHLFLKIVRYLGALCSQLEESNGSLNLSNSSFDSFNEDLPSSTVLEDFTEAEISAVNDATVCNDPLALTRDNTPQTPFKTPLTTLKNANKIDFKTPLNSVSKSLRMPLRTPNAYVKKQFHLTPSVIQSESNLNETELLQLKISLAKKDKEICEVMDMYLKNISDSEQILKNSLTRISFLEEKVLKLENVSADFKLRKEMLTAENCNIKELLNKNIEEIAEIRKKLVIEITSLNPQLEGTLSDVCVSKLLNIFLYSIMENCKKMQEELSQKLRTEINTLNEETEIYEGKLSQWEKEVNMLKELNATLLNEKEEIEKQVSTRDDEIRILQFESCELKSLKIKVKDLEERLEKSDDRLKTEVYLKESVLKDLQRMRNLFGNMENDNNDLKVRLEQSDKTNQELNINLIKARKEQEDISELQDDEQQQLNTLESELEKYKKAEVLMCNTLEGLNAKLTAYETELTSKTELVEAISLKLEEADKSKLKYEDIISELKEKLKDLEKENTALKSVESALEHYKDVEKLLSGEIESLNLKLKLTEVDLKEKMEIIDKITTQIEETRNSKSKDENIISELRAQVKEFESTVERMINENKNLLEKVENINSDFVECKGHLEEKSEVISRMISEINQAKYDKDEFEGIIFELKSEIEKLENDITRLREFESLFERLKETECDMYGRMDILNSRLLLCEADLSEKIVAITKLCNEIQEAKEIKIKDEEVISNLRMHVEQIEREKGKAEELELLLKKSRDSEEILSEKVEDLTSRLSASEVALEENLQLVAETNLKLVETECINTKNMEIILDLKKQIKNFENDKTKIEELQSTIKNLKEVEKMLLIKVEDLNLSLQSSEAEKMELELKILSEVEEASETNAKNEEMVAMLRLKVEEFDNEKEKIEEFEEAMLKLKEKEKIMSERMDNLNSRLFVSEQVLNEKNETLALLHDQLAEAKLIKAENDSTILALREELDTLRNLQLTSDTADHERKEKETLIEDLHNKLNEFSSEIECLQEKLYQAERDLKLHEEKVIRLEEIESDLMKYKKMVEELTLDCDKMKELQNHLLKVTNELEMRNKELEDMNNDLLQKQIDYEKLTKNNSNEIKLLESLSIAEDRLRLNKAESENLQKQLGMMEEQAAEMKKAISELNAEVIELRNSKAKSTTKCKNLEDENQIVVQDLKDLQEIFIEKKTPLKSVPMIRQRSRLDMSPPHKSRRLEKLENLNDLLNGTLQKIITALNIPVNCNFFSVDCYETSETQVMKYITGLKFIKNDMSELSEFRNESNITSEKYEEMCRLINELKMCLFSVLKYLGLPEEVKSCHEIISKIEKIKCEVKAELLERISSLRQDNQHLDDDNNLLQKKTKKLVKLITLNKVKLSALEKSEDLLKAEVENLRSELLKYQGKSKINRKTDLCNRKLDRLEELHQSLIDMLKKILTMMEMENVQKLNLFTPRTFDIESRKIFDHVSNWILKKSNEVQELKAQITELDEECESYAKKIKEDSQQIYKAWEEVRTLELEKGKLEEEKKSLKHDLEKLQVKGISACTSDLETDWKKEVESLKEKNISLKLQISALNTELAQSKKQREELDEECESLAIAVKQEGEQRIKIWEEFKNELKTLNDRIEKLEEEKSCLKSENENLLKEIKDKENVTNNDCQDVKDGLTCNCRKQSKEVKELRSAIVVKDMKILELEQLNEKNVVRKTQMKVLENSLSAIKKKLAEENEVNRKLQAEIKELSNQNRSQQSEILGKLRMREYGIVAVNHIEEREKLQKLEKDNRMLKELCRTRYNEIKRLETENLSLKGHERLTKRSEENVTPKLKRKLLGAKFETEDSEMYSGIVTKWIHPFGQEPTIR